jgi:hypothetical protein
VVQLAIKTLYLILNCDKTKIGLKRANKTPLMLEVTVNNKLKLGIIIFFFKAGLTRQSFIDTLYYVKLQVSILSIFFEVY